jgi:hypothetical protein
VARALRLEYYALKRRTSEAAAAPREDVSPNFVEVWVSDAGKVNGKLREHFDLVAGTSTGGSLAAAVGTAPYPHLWVTLPDAEGVKQLSPGSAPRRRRKRHPG